MGHHQTRVRVRVECNYINRGVHRVRVSQLKLNQNTATFNTAGKEDQNQ